MTSRLDAVNTILTASGEQPVSALINTTADVANAESILDETSRDVQARGWHFNTEKDVPFVPDSDGFINLPANVVKIDTDVYRYADIDPVQRGSRLYDRKNRTYVFKRKVEAEVVYFLPFEELPEQARRYIAMKAARVFHTRFIGAEVVFQFTQREEDDALGSLKKAELANADSNFFASNPAMARRAYRR